MTSRQTNLVALLGFLLIAPAGIFVYFTSPGMGYPKGQAVVIAGLVAAAGLALLPVVLRKVPPPGVTDGAIPPRAGWAVLLGFLLLALAVLAYFALQDG